MTRHQLVLFAALLCFASAACSSNGSAAGSTTTVVTTTPSSDTTTSRSPTTTTAIVAAEPEPQYTTEEQEVIDAYLHSEDIWTQCVYNVPACDEELLGRGYDGDFLKNIATLVSRWKADELQVLPPINEDHLRVEVLGVTLADDGITAVVRSCAIDGRRLISPSKGPDGEDLVLDDAVASNLGESVLSYEEPVGWRVTEGTSISVFDGAEGCVE